MIKIETKDTGDTVSLSDIKEAQAAYETTKAYRRIIFMRAIAEGQTYRWVSKAAGLSVGSVYQLVNGYYKKK